MDSPDTVQKTESQETREPWGPTIPGLTNIANQANDLAGTNQEFFPGQTFQGMDSNQQQILANMGGNMQGYQDQFVNPANEAWGQQMDLDRSYWDNALDSFSSNVGRNFNEHILPGLRDNYTSSGDFGRRSSAQGLDAMMLGERALGQIGEMGSMLNVDFERMRSQNQASALANTGNMMNLNNMPGNMQFGNVTRQRQDAAKQLEEDMARHNFEQNQGTWGNLNNSFNLLNPMGGQFMSSMGDTTKTTSGGGMSPFQKMLGIGTTVAGVASGNPFMAMGGMGMGGGGNSWMMPGSGGSNMFASGGPGGSFMTPV